MKSPRGRVRGQALSAQLELGGVEDDDFDILQDAQRHPCCRPAAAAWLTVAAGLLMMLSSFFDLLPSIGRLEPPPAAPPPPPPPSAPTRLQLIIDTDMAFDVDDVGAVCVAHALADLHEVDILAVVHDAGLFEGVGAAGALNTYYGRPNIQLGAFKGKFGANVAGPYVRDLASRFPSPVLNYSQVPSCGEAYRRALSTAPDGSVAIAAIGFMVCLRDLLMSGADEFSSFNGRELVAKKVTKVVFQGGWYAPLHPNGHDTFNWNCGRGWGFNPSDDGCNGAAQYVLANMPPTVQMIFSDIGDEVLHGGKLTTCAAPTNPCRQAYVDYLGPGGSRQSWDPVVVMLAVRGPERSFGSLTDVGFHNVADDKGANFWSAPKQGETKPSLQAQFTLDGTYPFEWATPRAALSNALDELLCHAPRLASDDSTHR